jgi:hypothetical protein
VVEELVYRRGVAWRDLPTASVVSGGKRYRRRCAERRPYCQSRSSEAAAVESVGTAA